MSKIRHKVAIGYVEVNKCQTFSSKYLKCLLWVIFYSWIRCNNYQLYTAVFSVFIVVSSCYFCAHSISYSVNKKLRTCWDSATCELLDACRQSAKLHIFSYPTGFIDRLWDHRILRSGSASTCVQDSGLLWSADFNFFVSLCNHNPPTLQTDRQICVFPLNFHGLLWRNYRSNVKTSGVPKSTQSFLYYLEK